MSVEVFAIISLVANITATAVALYVLRVTRGTDAPGRTISLVLLLIFLPPVGILTAAITGLWRVLRQQRRALDSTRARIASHWPPSLRPVESTVADR